MAIIKAVSSKQSINGIIDYITREEKIKSGLVSGIGCEPDPETAKEQMQLTKEIWGKTGGRTYKHFSQSFHKDEKITPEEVHRIACELAKNIPAWKGHEVLIATHEDKNELHSHFVVNSVNYEDGHKLQWSKADLKNMKKESDRLCAERGLHICEKGKTFEGEEREETSAYTKEAYQQLKKAEQGEVKSYVQDIALSVLDCKEQSISREDFIKKMNDRGYGVDWQDNHKYITYTDLAREQQGEKKCKVRNNKLEQYYNMDFSKEGMEREFEINARSKQTTERAREQLESNRGAEPNHIGTGADNIGAFLTSIFAQIGNAEDSREKREAERSRQRAEAERKAEARKQRIETKSHDRDRGR